MISEALRSYGEEYWQNAVLDLTPDTLVEWCLGNTAESCETCAKLADAGPITAAEFADRGLYPQSHDLACGGYHCRCFLVFLDVPAAIVEDAPIGVSDTLGVGAVSQGWEALPPLSAAETSTSMVAEPEPQGRTVSERQWFQRLWAGIPRSIATAIRSFARVFRGGSGG